MVNDSYPNPLMNNPKVQQTGFKPRNYERFKNCGAEEPAYREARFFNGRISERGIYGKNESL